MRELAALKMRIEALAVRAAEADPDAALLAELDALLSEGYAWALDGDARLRRLDDRLEGLIRNVEEPAVAKEVRRVALERRSLDRSIADLRARLAEVRDHFVRLGGARGLSA
jgi:hypothetical protein